MWEKTAQLVTLSNEIRRPKETDLQLNPVAARHERQQRSVPKAEQQRGSVSGWVILDGLKNWHLALTAKESVQHSGAWTASTCMPGLAAFHILTIPLSSLAASKPEAQLRSLLPDRAHICPQVLSCSGLGPPNAPATPQCTPTDQPHPLSTSAALALIPDHTTRGHELLRFPLNTCSTSTVTSPVSEVKDMNWNIKPLVVLGNLSSIFFIIKRRSGTVC